MTNRAWIILFSLLLVAGIGAYAFQQPPTVTIVPAVPSTVPVNSTTTVTITAQISDSRVLPSGVNLLQVAPVTGSQTIIGSMHDDGLNGDAAAGDHIFTILIRPLTNTSSLLTYRVSAAFRGILRRSLSPVITVAVVPIGVVVPPDPGPAGAATLAGIDSDGDGVRDDLQRWIVTNYSDSAAMRSALTQYAKAVQVVILSGGNDSQQAATTMNVVGRAQFCANRTEFLLHRSGLYSYKAALAQLLNTYARARAFYSADEASSGHFFGTPQPGHELDTCDVNPTSLPN